MRSYCSLIEAGRELGRDQSGDKAEGLFPKRAGETGAQRLSNGGKRQVFGSIGNMSELGVEIANQLVLQSRFACRESDTVE